MTAEIKQHVVQTMLCANNVVRNSWQPGYAPDAADNHQSSYLVNEVNKDLDSVLFGNMYVGASHASPSNSESANGHFLYGWEDAARYITLVMGLFVITK